WRTGDHDSAISRRKHRVGLRRDHAVWIPEKEEKHARQRQEDDRDLGTSEKGPQRGKQQRTADKRPGGRVNAHDSIVQARGGFASVRAGRAGPPPKIDEMSALRSARVLPCVLADDVFHLVLEG